MRIRKKSLMISVIAALILSIVATRPVFSQGTVFVNPLLVLGASGTEFSITVEVDEGIWDLWGWEFKLWYDPSVLTATLSTPSADFPDVSINQIDNDIGLVWIAASLPLGTEVGLDGPLSLAEIEFSVDGSSESVLDIDEDYMFMISAAGEKIYPTIIDGDFTSEPPLASLWAKLLNVKKRHMDVCTIQTIKGLITNKGEEGTYVRAQFVIVDATTHTPVDVATSDELWIGPGEDVWVTAEWHAGEPGSYYVTGVIELSLDGIYWVNYDMYKEMLGGLESFRVVQPSWFKVA